MKQAEFKKALKKFNEVFAYLLEHKITYPEIYRIYANKGVCHFALGEAARGKFMLEISAELNSFYDFARQQIERYKKDAFAQVEKTKKEEDITRDIGYQYCQFLKKFKINFNHPLKGPTNL